MSKDKAFIKGTLIYLTSNVISAAIPFLLLPILTRYLSPEEFGKVAMFQVYIGLLAAFVGLNVNGAVVRQFYDKNSNVSFVGYFSSAFIILVLSFLLSVFVIYICNGVISNALSIEKSWLYIGLLVSLMAFVIKLALSQYQVNKQPLKFGVIQILLALVNASLSLFFILKLGFGAEGRVLGILYANTLISIVCLFLIYKMNLLNFKKVKRSYFSDSFSYGVNLIPHFCGIFLLSTADRFVINTNMGLYEAGIYMAAVQVCRVFPIFFDALNKAYVPWLFEKLSNDVFSEKVTVIKLTYGYILLLLLISIIVYFISPYLVLPILGDSYNEVASIIGYLAFGSCIQGIYYMFTNYIIYAKKTKVLSGITLASGLINILLSFLFIINYGLVGVCYAFIVANSLRITLTFIFAARYVNMPWYLFNGKN